MLMEIPRDSIIRRDGLGIGMDGGQGEGEAACQFVDFATKPIPEGVTISKYRGGITTHFPALLHAVLTRAEGDGYEDVCSWHSHGRAFLVHNRQRFVKEVMPRAFRQTQFASFQRQMNLYGFQRISNNGTSDAGAYYHAMFLRTRYDLCPAIQRTTEKELRERKLDDKSRGFEPDFSSMDPMPANQEKHLTEARGVSNPQRKEPGAESKAAPKKKAVKKDPPSRATKAKPKVPLKAPKVPKDDLVDDTFGLLFADRDGEPRKDDNVDSTFSSLFFDQGEPGISWMEPRPIAPQAEQMLQSTGAILSGSVEMNNNVGTTKTNNVRDMTLPLIPASAAAIPRDNTNIHGRSKPKRSRADASNPILFPKEQDEGMVSFLDDVDLSDDECPPPQKLLNTSSPMELAVNAREAASRHLQDSSSSAIHSGFGEPFYSNTTHSRSEDAFLTGPPPSLAIEKSPPLNLPRSFRDISQFPADKSLMVTSAQAPYSVVYVNSRLEAEFKIPSQALVDTQFLDYCPERAYRTLSSATQCVRMTQTNQSGIPLCLSLGQERQLPCVAMVGPFFMSDDSVVEHIGDVQYLAWHFEKLS